MLVTSDIKTMSSPTKETQKPSQKLSFSISRILGNTDDRKAQTTRTERAVTEEPRVPYFGTERTVVEAPRVPYIGTEGTVIEAPRVPYIGTIHHYAFEPETGETSQLDISGRPRACSTPENEEYPSPTPTYNLVPHGFHVPHPHPLSYHTSPTFYNHGVQRLSSPEASPTDIPLKPSVKCFDSCSDKSLDSLGESYQTSPSPLKLKKKKTRTVFSRSQIYQLESAFDMKRYLSSAERGGLATRLNLSETQIKIWFQNRRNKWKRQINGEMDEIPVPPGFAAGFLSQQPYCPPSLNSASHVSATSEELYRNRLAAPYNYAHPYSLEHRRPMSFLH